MKELRTIVVDDERAGRARLCRMLEREPGVRLVAECKDGPEAIAAVRMHRPDAAFLDIRMPGMDGFEMLEALGPHEQPESVVFVTAYDEHAVRAFEVCALDYLLKPVSAERLAVAVARARERAGASAPNAATAPTPQRFAARSGNRVSFVAPDEIEWVEAAGNYMILHAGVSAHMIRETLGGMQERLPSANFHRVSRSAIVNLRHVRELKIARTGECFAVLADGTKVRVTQPLRDVADRLAAFPGTSGTK